MSNLTSTTTDRRRSKFGHRATITKCEGYVQRIYSGEYDLAGLHEAYGFRAVVDMLVHLERGDLQSVRAYMLQIAKSLKPTPAPKPTKKPRTRTV